MEMHNVVVKAEQLEPTEVICENVKVEKEENFEDAFGFSFHDNFRDDSEDNEDQSVSESIVLILRSFDFGH